MRDTFTEYIVEKRRTKATKLFKALLVCAGVFLILAVVLLWTRRSVFFTLLAVLLLATFTYYASTGMNVEYEYTVTNGELDVDKITAKRNRRRLITVHCGQVESFGRYRPQEHQGKGYHRRIFACDSRSGGALWYCAVRCEGGVALVVFNASEQMLEGMRPYLPRSIADEAFPAQGDTAN